MRLQLEPMKKVARTLRNHRELLLNWFRAKGALSSGVIEGPFDPQRGQQSKTVPGNRTAFAPTKLLKPPSITTLKSYPNQNLPTDSGEEADFYRWNRSA